MLQRRQIVIETLCKQIDTEDLERIKYDGRSFHSIAWILIFDIVTIKRNAAVLQGYENSLRNK
jgi:hypothetical protein